MSITELMDRQGTSPFVGFGLYDEVLKSHSLETLIKERVAGFLPLNMEEGRDGVRIFAKKEQRIPLSSHMEMKRFDLDRFLKLTPDLLSIAEEGETYLLDREDIVLDSRYIFEGTDGHFEVFHLPVKQYQKDFSERLHGFLKELFLSAEISSGEENLKDYREVFYRLQGRDFSLEEFGRFSEEMVLARKLRKGSTEEEKEIIDAFYENTAQNKKKDEWAELYERKKLLGMKSGLLSPRVLEVAAMLGWIAFLGAVLFLKLGVKEAVGGSGLFILCLVLIHRTKTKDIVKELGDGQWAGMIENGSSKKEKGQPEEIAYEPEEQEFMEMSERIRTEEEMENPRTSIEKMRETNVTELKNFAVEEKESFFMETVLISDMRKPYIVALEDEYGDPVSEEDGEKCYINDGIFIGRNRELADFVLAEGAVGKIHSEIWREGGKKFLKDLASKNGTWLNGEKLKTDEAVELRDGDIIIFASRKCIFREI